MEPHGRGRPGDLSLQPCRRPRVDQPGRAAGPGALARVLKGSHTRSVGPGHHCRRADTQPLRRVTGDQVAEELDEGRTRVPGTGYPEDFPRPGVARGKPAISSFLNTSTVRHVANLTPVSQEVDPIPGCNPILLARFIADSPHAAQVGVRQVR